MGKKIVTLVVNLSYHNKGANSVIFSLCWTPIRQNMTSYNSVIIAIS